MTSAGHTRRQQAQEKQSAGSGLSESLTTAAPKHSIFRIIIFIMQLSKPYRPYPSTLNKKRATPFEMTR